MVDGADRDPLFAPPVVAGDSALQSVVLEGLSEAVNYRQWLAALARPWLGHDPIEVGSGNGDYAATWADQGVPIVATEGDGSRFLHLQRRFAEHPLVQVRFLHVPITESARHSAVVAYNVLEHIADDVGALRAFSNLVGAGGHVVVLVPAFPIAMSRFDREIGHYRRYRRAGLVQAMANAGLETFHIQYVNPVGLMAWIAGMRLLRRRPTPGLGVRVYDQIVPVLQRLESHRPAPFGQSLFAVARRPS